jgi:hypothetical protein
MNRETLTMALLGSGGGIKALRNMYPNLSERNVFNVASIAISKNNMHKKLNQKANSVRNVLLEKYIARNALLRNAGGMAILRRNYPHISPGYIHKVLTRFSTVKQLRTFLNKKKPSITGKKTLLTRLKKVKRLPPIYTKKSSPPKKAFNTMKNLITALEKKPMNMSKLFNSLPFNKTGVLHREYI